MENEELKTHGNCVDNSGKTDKRLFDAVGARWAVFRKVIDTPIEDLPPEDRREAVRILAQGVVNCCLVFIVLSVFYPDRVTAALAIITPIITLLMQYRSKLKEQPQSTGETLKLPQQQKDQTDADR